MKLVIRDVAALLTVAEKTVRRWIVPYKLPAPRVCHQRHFKRGQSPGWAATRLPLSTAENIRHIPTDRLAGTVDPLCQRGISNHAICGDRHPLACFFRVLRRQYHQKTTARDAMRKEVSGEADKAGKIDTGSNAAVTGEVRCVL